MKKVIIGLIVGALCCGLFSAPVDALKYDPNLPSQDVYEHSEIIRPNGDDTSWDDPLTSSNLGNEGYTLETISQPVIISCPQMIKSAWNIVLRLINGRDIQSADLIQPNVKDID